MHSGAKLSFLLVHINQIGSGCSSQKEDHGDNVLEHDDEVLLLVVKENDENVAVKRYFVRTFHLSFFRRFCVGLEGGLAPCDQRWHAYKTALSEEI
jgi:hypothetical protein